MSARLHCLGAVTLPSRFFRNAAPLLGSRHARARLRLDDGGVNPLAH